MRVTDTPPPSLAAEDIQRLLRECYGVDGTLSPLVSERDQNFRVDIDNGPGFVAKIANIGEATDVTDFQVEALRHLERAGCPVTVPKVIPALDGQFVTSVVSGNDCYRMRLVTWVAGAPLVGKQVDPPLARALGESLAALDAGLANFSHPGERQELLWDMQRALEVREGLPHVRDHGLRELVSRCFDDFERDALPAFSALRVQVIHNDLNPGNVLVTDDRPARVAGVIDFGDMVKAPLVVDVAIAASYLRSDAADALRLAAALVAGFDSVTPLDDDELVLVHGLMRTRLATTIVMMYTRLSRQSTDDAYLEKTLLSEDSAQHFLARLEAVSADAFADRVRGDTGLLSPF
jgi:Ser/Thr protein kinase RdoA (MazF antagonist)